MNQDTLKGQWHQMKGRAKQRWGKLNDDALDRMEGRREELVGELQEKYGMAREEANREVNEWLDSLESDDDQNS